MTTTFCGIVLGLGLLAIWTWLTISLIKIKCGVVASWRSHRRFEMETQYVRFLMFCMFISSMGLISGSIIRLFRGV